MRRLALAVILAIAGGCLPLVFHAAAGPSMLVLADTLTVAPGAGHGFLIDKHIAAGLACNSCHAATPSRPVSMAACLSCHGGAYDKLAAMTASDDPNPHRSHQGEAPCAACHHVHMASENFCSQCHSEFDIKVP